MAESAVAVEVGPGLRTPVAYRVADRQVELIDTVGLTLEPVDLALPPAAPGQFDMLWAFGVGEVPISLSRLPDPGGTARHHTVRAVGAATRALCALRPGDPVGVRGPFGRGWDVGSARGHDVVVVAGGLGLAPVRPLLEAVASEREAFGRVVVLVGARGPGDVLFADVLERWRSADLDVRVTVDHADPGWRGHVGVVTGLVPGARLAPDARAYVCGPEIMMRFAGSALVDAGLAPEHVEVSLERNMVCAVALCGHCQLGPTFVCREGPVYGFDVVGPLLGVRAL